MTLFDGPAGLNISKGSSISAILQFVIYGCDLLTFHSSWKKRRERWLSVMKRIKEKFRRTVKYLRVSYKQASLDERMLMGMGALVMLVYAWWVVVVL